MRLFVTGAPGSELAAVAEAIGRLDPLRVRVPPAGGEPSELDDVDQAVLSEAGGRWLAPPDPSRALGGEDLARWARGAVARVAADEGWVWTAASLSITLPFWREAMAGAPRVVLVVRRPDDAARALEGDEGLPPAYGLALWERCLRSAVSAADGLEVFVVPLADLAASLRAIAEFAGMTPDDDAIAAAAEALPPTGGTRKGDAPPGQQDLLDALTGLAGPHAPFHPPDLPDEPPGVQLAFEEHARLVEAERSDRERALAHEVARLRGEVSGLADEVEGRTQEIGRLSRDLAYMAERAEDMERRALAFYQFPPVKAYAWVKTKLGRGEAS